ncbi:YopT-type cysteine protease domain-containing protein [Microbulbifer sp. THAF38]|uniref:YopT-type cysteine protease domain-containing protein n=1 Tax=unclassified Microbulbifer TaxID=2619833 RepID=UPI00126793BD|nr:YopT-type cysteine protease domain-containing protein [Microbulbifer sp. THAF38]QFT53062.1 Cysteine protease YopT [Microbulbifer sp. THAF38]
MPIWVDKTILNVTGTRVRPVQQAVPNYNGHVVKDFSQCFDPVKGLITVHEDTSGGVCESLSAFWMKYHSEGGSLWNWLYPNNTFDERHLFHVMTLQQAGMHDDQDRVTEAWLGVHNLYPVSQNVFGGAFPNGRGGNTIRGINNPRRANGQSGVFSPNALAREIILDQTGGAGCYKKISLDGTFSGHTMSAWVAQDIAFFDPNFGEFWFESRASFFNWFTQSFWYQSMYSAGLSGSYAIRSYARRG